MIPRRRVLALATAGVALLGLTGCEKPTPLVTLQAGSSVVHSEASSWAHEVTGAAVTRDVAPPTLRFAPGERLTIDVSRAVVKRRWFVQQAEIAKPSNVGKFQVQDDHVFSFYPDRPVTLSVVALAGDTDDRVTGEWVFTVLPED